MPIGDARRRALGVLTANDRLVRSVLESPPIRQWPRDALVRECGISDRAVRDAIANLRKAHVPILSSSSRPGYRIAQTADEIAECRREFLERGRDLLTTAGVLGVLERMQRDREREGIAEQMALL